MNTRARRLDRKLGHIAGGRYEPADFVLADAKDADMAFGVTSAGPVSVVPDVPDTKACLGSMRTLVGHGVLDVL
ncbi:MAG: hypothetical protein R6W93_01095 [Candidatus Limnocylindrales bacterium]